MSLTSAPSESVETYVLDSWPFLEKMLRSIPVPRLDFLIESAERAEIVLLLSEMNVGEIFYLLAKQTDETHAEAAVFEITRLPVRIVPVSSGDVLRAARLKARYPLSYADCFCAGLTIAHGAAVVTGDPDFLQLQRDGLLRVHWVGA